MFPSTLFDVTVKPEYQTQRTQYSSVDAKCQGVEFNLTLSVIYFRCTISLTVNHYFPHCVHYRLFIIRMKPADFFVPLKPGHLFSGIYA